LCPHYIDVSLRDLGEEKPQKKEEKQKEKKLTKLYGGGYFQEFQWMPDSYDAYYEAQQKDKEENKIKREAISAKDFIVAPPKTKGMIASLAKFESCFFDNLNPYAFVSCTDPYEACKDDMARANLIEGDAMLNSVFKPSTMDKCLERVCRTQLPDILISIKKRIGTDWPELKFVVCGILINMLIKTS
jgi:hypothetical protein